jgi:hypothetical protein
MAEVARGDRGAKRRGVSTADLFLGDLSAPAWSPNIEPTGSKDLGVSGEESPVGNSAASPAIKSRGATDLGVPAEAGVSTESTPRGVHLVGAFTARTAARGRIGGPVDGVPMAGQLLPGSPSQQRRPRARKVPLVERFEEWQ